MIFTRNIKKLLMKRQKYKDINQELIKERENQLIWMVLNH